LFQVNTIAFPQPQISGDSAPVTPPPVGVVRDIDAALQLLETPSTSHDTTIVRQARRALASVEKLLQTLPPTHELGALLDTLARCRTPSPEQRVSAEYAVSPDILSPSRIAERVLSDTLAQLNAGELSNIQHVSIHRIDDGATLSCPLPNRCQLVVTVRRTCPEIDRTQIGIWRLEGCAFDASGEHDLTTFCEELGSTLPTDIQERILHKLHECVNACHCTIIQWPMARHMD